MSRKCRPSKKQQHTKQTKMSQTLTQGHKSVSVVLLPLSTQLSKGRRTLQMVHQRVAVRGGGRREWAEAAADDIRMGK